MRTALSTLRELIEDYSVTIALLPTGYGKSRFFKYNVDLVDQLGKIIHALPLRAIVSELAKDLDRVLGHQVGYQAGIYIENVNKTPFLTAKYTIATLDSFFMNFYGIPISELWRSVWHSDVAFLLSRTSHMILDEVHLVTTPDEIDKIEDEFVKVISIIRDLIRWNIKVGLKTIILTATLYPWIIKYILPQETQTKTAILVYAPENHPYIKVLKDLYNNIAHIKIVWNREDEFYKNFENYEVNVSTHLHFSTMEDLLSKFEDLEPGNRVAVIFNSVRRCIETYENYHEGFKAKGFNTIILHGQMTPYAREKHLNILKNSERAVLFSTQVVEAGVDLDFDTLITEVAPPHTLVQRVGRVARYGVRSDKKYRIHIVIGGCDVDVGVQKLCKNIYDVDLTKHVIYSIMGYARSSEDYVKEIRINWRLPKENEKLDYLKLLMLTEEPHISFNRYTSFLERLSIWRARADVLKRLDEEFGGSFVRSSALIPIYFGPMEDGKWQLGDLISKYTVTVDINFIMKRGKEILDIDDEERVKIVSIVGDEQIKVSNGPPLSNLKKYPLHSLHREISKLRRELREEEGVVSRILFLGLKANPRVKFDVEEGYIS